MPTPTTSQPSANMRNDGAIAKMPRPAAQTKLETAKTSRPPKRSMVRPTCGPSNAEISSEAEKAPKTAVDELAVSRAIAGARIAIR